MLIYITASSNQLIVFRCKELPSEREGDILNRTLQYAMDDLDDDFNDDSVIKIINPQVQGDFFTDIGIACLSCTPEVSVFMNCRNIAQFEVFCERMIPYLQEIKERNDILQLKYSEQLRIEDVRNEFSDNIPHFDTRFKIDINRISFPDSNSISDSIKAKLENNPALREFIDDYIYCPICGESNEVETLIDFYESNVSALKKIRKKLRELKKHDTIRGIPIQIGIPCCNCFHNVLNV